MVRLDDSGQRCGAALTGPRFGCLMERRDMVSELVHQGRIQSVGLGELVEQRRLIEAAHHHDPIDDATLGTKTDLSIRSVGQRSDLQIKLRRRASVEHELGLARYPALFRGREVKVRKFYCKFEFVSAVAGKKNQRHMSFDDVDLLNSRSVRGGRLR